MTPKLIDKRKLVEHCFEVVCKLDKQGDNIAADALKKHILWYLVDAESVDAVPVVRCRDCEHWKPSGSRARNSFSDMEYIGGCEFTKYCRRESDFCSYGERKENYA